MSPQDRLAEIGEILAKGYLKLLDSRETCPNVAPGAQESLAEAAENEAPCALPIARSESGENKEVA